MSFLLGVFVFSGCGQPQKVIQPSASKSNEHPSITSQNNNKPPPAPPPATPHQNTSQGKQSQTPSLPPQTVITETQPTTTTTIEQASTTGQTTTTQQTATTRQTGPTQPQESEISSSQEQEVFVEIKGLANPQTAFLTVKDQTGHIVATLKTNQNQKINLASLNLQPGSYTVLAETPNYRVSKPQTLIVEAQGPSQGIVFVFEKITDNLFHYHWENDFSDKEYEYSSQPPSTPQIEFLDEVIDTPHQASSQMLREKYNIILSNENVAWTLDYANRLLRIVSRIPHKPIRKTKFVLKNEHINGDIQVIGQDQQKTVFLSTYAFNNANPRLVRLNGVKGRFFSHRLFQALVYFYTHGGKDRNAAKKILQDQFNLSLTPNVQQLTGEHPDNFQQFKNDELLHIISALTEMPEGYYKIPGLRYLLRRKDGHPHPLYPEAPAVAWPRGPQSDSYIEFMDSAFRMKNAHTNQTRDYIHRLILHEKTHFIWGNLLSKNLQQEWIRVAGWYKNPEDPEGWSNRYTTSFVSPYAHKKNPNEDMAETVSYYILNPSKLLSVAPDKFNFIKNHIMQGNQYIIQVREDLQFEVLNLFPDYDFPGKIKRVDVFVYGTQDQDKRIEVEIELLHKEGLQDGASSASMRIYSEKDTFVDMHLHPVGGNAHILRGQAHLSKNVKAGYWKVDQIVVTDQNGLQRMEGVDDFGFKLYINNALEDTTPPKYVKDSLKIAVNPVKVQGRLVNRVTITWDIEENMQMKHPWGVFVEFVSLDHSQAYAIQKYGTVNPKTHIAKVVFDVTEYFPSGRYSVAYLSMQDRALNTGKQYFSNNPKHERQKIVQIATANHDRVKPTLDVHRISVSARPVHPSHPDGQTEVTITYYAKDDKSGLGLVNYRLVDPTGKTFFEYHYHDNFYTTFFKGDPTVYKKYVIRHILPKGSVPGIWGLYEMNISDKGGNTRNYNFSETLHFSLE